MKTCTKCDNPAYRKSFCWTHYQIDRTSREIRKCTIENCTNMFFAKGICEKHYYAIKEKDEKRKEYRHIYQASDRFHEVQLRHRTSEWGKLAIKQQRNRYTALGLTAFRNAQRKKAVKRATIPCSDAKQIKKIYTDCPDDAVVDHIIPINGKIVSGLNVPWNLQYLTNSENAYKTNRFDDTYDNVSWRTNYERRKMRTSSHG